MPEANKMPNWYEADLSLVERKKRGHFSTPPLLVKQILDACGYTAEADLSRLRVLDPACGSGNFLAEAAQRLLTSLAATSISERKRVALFQANLRGFDPDPIACFLTEMRLRASFESHTGKMLAGALPLHIHQADSLTLNWGSCVDLFLANPPYLAAKNCDLSGYRSALQCGQADSYLLFLDLAFQALRPQGWMGLVLPDPVLARANASQGRLRLLNESTIQHIWHFSGMFAAHVGAVVIIAQKCPPRRLHQVNWIRSSWPQHVKVFARTAAKYPPPCSIIPQKLFVEQPGSEFRYLLNSEEGALIERVRKHLETPKGRKRCFAPLSDFLQIRRGEELGRESPLLVEIDDTTADHCRVLRGGVDLRPYAAPHSRWGIPRCQITKPLARYQAPKLLVVKSTGNLQSTLDLQGHIALQTLYLLLPCRPEMDLDDLYFFMALLNSRLIRTYIYLLHTAYKLVQPQIEQHVLAHLPVPLGVGAEDIRRISQLAQKLRDACDASDPVVEWQVDSHNFYEKLESAIGALYEAVLPGLFEDKGVSLHAYYSPNSRAGRKAGT